jgi:hypothetical protein
MKLSQVKMDMLVAVNDLDDGTVYEVTEIQGHAAELHYKSNGRNYHGGWSDVSTLQKPSKKQLEHALKQA